MAALADVGGRLDVTTRKVALGGAAVASLGMAVVAGIALHHGQWSGRHGLESLEAAVEATPDAVVVATDGIVGRQGWEHVVDGEEWLLAEDPDELVELADALADEGRPIVLSTLDEEERVADLDASYEVVERRQPDPDSSRVVLTLSPR
jgi:hypothetical protein